MPLDNNLGHVGFKEWINTGHIQRILKSYLGTSSLSPTICMNFFDVIGKYPGMDPKIGVREYLEHARNLIQSGNSSLKRIVLPIYFPNHFGYCIIDPEKMEAIVGESFGGTNGYQPEIDEYKAIIRDIFSPKMRIVQVKETFQNNKIDTYSCGRISALAMFHFATSPLSLSEAANGDLSKLHFDTEAKTRELYDSQTQLLSQTASIEYYRQILTSLGIDAKDFDAKHPIFNSLHEAFYSCRFTPAVFGNAKNILADCSEDAKIRFKDLVAMYKLTLENKSQDSIDLFISVISKQYLPSEKLYLERTETPEERITRLFSWAVNAMLPQLAEGHCKKLREAKPEKDAPLLPSEPKPKRQIVDDEDAEDRKENAPPNAKTVGLSTAKPVPQKIPKKEDFLERYREMGHSVDVRGNDVLITIMKQDTNGSSPKGEVRIQRQNNKIVKATTETPTNEVLEVMADVIREGAGICEVNIEVSGNDTDSEVIALKNRLYLAANKKGLHVANYSPQDPAIVNEARALYRQAQNDNHSAPSPTASI